VCRNTTGDTPATGKPQQEVSGNEKLYTPGSRERRAWDRWLSHSKLWQQPNNGEDDE